jgi:hypothetical protein
MVSPVDQMVVAELDETPSSSSERTGLLGGVSKESDVVDYGWY